ncbi:nucleoside triphosphate pyrophosphohydrolase family protein [Hyalangium sp.]|uniref:nucleoside triphosphate pyrophosphohydrolase family protein n=1 Tax=Hyalangium sp. TaxID=2028555 RepID=UPI002D59B47F|nr:nucleoside triphosphate pyrophosphohydrolase family protein [Hyalangium sp.]HYH95910.1 nucleoside triphosphate pyrophosphohydrolase family protein [Hyalangium sp.]
MDFREYQLSASRTDQMPTDKTSGDPPTGPEIMMPLLGLAGEAGELLSEYKKYLRDGASYKLFNERIGEELGDLLWYLSNVASKLGLDLDKIARDNLAKCRNRWDEHGGNQLALLNGSYAFDEGYPPEQRLPRKMEVVIRPVDAQGRPRIQVLIDGKQVGDDLKDNTYTDDGYRFHDIFHFVYAAVLGWSPVLRSGRLLGRKRKANALVDEVEDGARAAALEEGISAMIFGYAAENDFLMGAKGVRSDLLRTIKMMTAHLEVSRCSAGDWEKAILMGFDVWRQIRDHNGGRILVDLDAASVTFNPDSPT